MAAAPTSASLKPASLTPAPRFHLGHLDGLRGLAALYVVVGHIFYGIDARTGHPLSARMGIASIPFLYNRISVAIFIVLSGYCLSLPLARSAALELCGGFSDYIRRRARRILPPYYAVLTLCLALTALIPALRHPGADAIWNIALPALRPAPIVSHVLLLHNLRPQWVYLIDPPLWSVATEWQIYFLLPLLLLPIWKRFGLAAGVLTGIAAGLLPCLLLRTTIIDGAPWFLGLFALGMGAAGINFSALPHLQELNRKVAWNGVCLLFLALSVALYARFGDNPPTKFITDTAVGLCAAAFLIECARRPQGYPNAATRFLQQPILVKLGAFSYSLYLIHEPIITLTGMASRRFTQSVVAEFCVTLFLGTLLSLALAYGFHLAFEKPFMTAPKKSAAS